MSDETTRLRDALERIAHEPCWEEPTTCLSQMRAIAAEALAATPSTPAVGCPTCDCWGGEHRPNPEAVR